MHCPFVLLWQAEPLGALAAEHPCQKYLGNSCGWDGKVLSEVKLYCNKVACDWINIISEQETAWLQECPCDTVLDSNWLASETWNDELVSSAVASTGRTSCLVEPVAGMLKQNLKKSITSRTCRPLARGLRKEASALEAQKSSLAGPVGLGRGATAAASASPKSSCREQVDVDSYIRGGARECVWVRSHGMA